MLLLWDTVIETVGKVHHARMASSFYTIARIPLALSHITIMVTESIGQPGTWTGLDTVWHRPAQIYLVSSAGRIKVLWKHSFAKENVIIEVYEVGRQSGNAVQIGLNSCRIEGGQVGFIGEYLPVGDHRDSRMIGIEPRRHLPIGHYEHVAMEIYIRAQ